MATKQVRVNGGRYRGETATALRLKAAFELLLVFTFISLVLNFVIANWNAGKDYGHELPGHVAFCVRALITGKRK